MSLGVILLQASLILNWPNRQVTCLPKKPFVFCSFTCSVSHLGSTVFLRRRSPTYPTSSYCAAAVVSARFALRAFLFLQNISADFLFVILLSCCLNFDIQILHSCFVVVCSTIWCVCMMLWAQKVVSSTDTCFKGLVFASNAILFK